MTSSTHKNEIAGSFVDADAAVDAKPTLFLTVLCPRVLVKAVVEIVSYISTFRTAPRNSSLTVIKHYTTK